MYKFLYLYELCVIIMLLNDYFIEAVLKTKPSSNEKKIERFPLIPSIDSVSSSLTDTYPSINTYMAL